MDARKTYNGSITTEIPAGYCLSERHNGFLTERQIIKKKCLEKRCKKFIRLEHECWSDKKDGD